MAGSIRYYTMRGKTGTPGYETVEYKELLDIGKSDPYVSSVRCHIVHKNGMHKWIWISEGDNWIEYGGRRYSTYDDYMELARILRNREVERILDGLP